MILMSKKARTFYVDSRDDDVSLWVKNQHNLSASLRRVIKDTVARVGTDDYGDAIANRLNELETGKPIKIKTPAGRQCQCSATATAAAGLPKKCSR